MAVDDNSPNNGMPSDAALQEMLDDLLNAGDGGAENNAPASDAAAAPEGEEPGDHSKVELDIDDAPFLEEEEPKESQKQEAAAPALRETAADESEEEPGGLKGFLLRLRKDKKRLAMVSGAALFILLAPLAFLVLTGKKLEPAPEPPVQAQTPQPEPPKETLPQENRFIYQSAGFLVPVHGSEGELRFMRLRYTIVSESFNIFSELQHKSIAIRDAVYHYLSKKPLPYLSGEEQVKLLRSDLINVINQQLGADKITELNFEEYLITGG